MARRLWGNVSEHLQALYSLGTVADLTDKELLERFVSRRDGTGEAAFSAIVERHGAMVLHVCRSVLRDDHDIHDAFQATFLVLVRRAGTLWVGDSLGAWLHEVALRTSSCARAAGIRRRRHERGAAQSMLRVVNDDQPDDTREILHEEIGRLPDRSRAPIVLCLVEGLTYEQAARRLGCPADTLKSRLAAGRERLRRRLTRRGVVPAIVGSGSVLSGQAIATPVPPDLLICATRMAEGIGVGAAGSSEIVLATVTSLVKATIRGMFMSKLKTIAVALLLAGGLAAGVDVIAKQNGERPRPSQPVDTSWMGKRVILKPAGLLYLQFPGENRNPGGEPPMRGEELRALSVYRVKEIRGTYLRLEADHEQRGWVSPVDVIPLEKAIEFFTDQIRENPKDPAHYSYRAFVWHSLGDRDKALQDADETIRLDPDKPHHYVRRGAFFHYDAQFDKALADYDKAIALNPMYVAAYNDRGLLWEAKAEYDKAINDYSEWIRLAPTDANAYRRRGDVWRRKREYDKAITDFSTAIRLAPTDADAYRGRGDAWSEKKEYDKAIADFSEVIRLAPNAADAYKDRGYAWSKQIKYDKAIADFSTAIRLVPTDADAYVRRGEAWTDKEEYDKAIADLSTAIHLAPTDADAYWRRGYAWSENRRYDKALADIGEAIRLDPKVVAPYLAQARIWATCPNAKFRDGEQALKSATRACELTHWKDADAIDILAAAYAETGDFDKAVKWQTKANAMFIFAGSDDIEQGEACLKLYEQKTPYRDPPEED
jgi:RNA polymerase sigma factor (sigma-70 family)